MEIHAHEVYTPDEVKSLLKISRSTFLRLIKKGILQAQKVGGQYRILGQEVLRLVKPELGKVRNRMKRQFQKV